MSTAKKLCIFHKYSNKKCLYFCVNPILPEDKDHKMKPDDKTKMMKMKQTYQRKWFEWPRDWEWCVPQWTVSL